MAKSSGATQYAIDHSNICMHMNENIKTEDTTTITDKHMTIGL